VRVLSTNVYVGPNLYASFPVIRHVVDLGPLEAWPTGRLGSTFRDTLVARLPGLAEHTCSYGEPGGFLRRMREDEGTWLGHVWEHVALQLQVLAGADVSFGKTRSADVPGRYTMVYQYHQRDVGLEAGDLARRLLLDLLPDDAAAELDAPREPDFDWDTERDDFIRFVQRRELGPSTASLVQAAEERGIPWLRLNRYSLVQFGHGRYQERIQATVTSETRHIAVEIASDKDETHTLLRDLGLPVPTQRLVYSDEQAVRAARMIGYPVVCKPLDGNHGRGVTIGIADDDEAAAGFASASAEGRSRGVVVEGQVLGLDHRMLVVDGRLVAVAKRIPGHVVGDGVHTVEELVDLVNADPRRGVGHEKVLTRLELDRQAHELLAAHGSSLDTVLPDGEVLYLRNTANLSTGGTATDVTDVVHPDNRTMAERAVGAVGLDVGGVDFLTRDITQSYKDIGGGIVEVNAAPGFRMHVAPTEGQSRDVAGPVMDMLFPPGTPSRIPIAAITGTNGKTTTTRMVAHILKGAGETVGTTTTDGVYIDGRLTVAGDMTGPTSAQMVLRDPSVSIAVLETARGGLLRAGMGYAACDVGAVLNVSGDHLGLKGIDSLEQLAEVKRIVIEATRGTAVLNADDALCLEMADHTDAETICYVTMSPSHDLVREHIRSGGRAVVIEKGINGDQISLHDRGAHIPLLWTHLIPATLEGRALHNVQNAMFAAAIAFSLDVDIENIRMGLRTFQTTFYQAPGRMNLWDEHPFRVLLDYAHNPAAVEMVCGTVDRFDVTGTRSVVVTAPGDRRDDDIAGIARAVAGSFDRFVLRTDDDTRGRDRDEITGIQRGALLDAGIPDDAITVIPDEVAAVDHALSTAEPGDLLVVFGDDITRTWKQIIRFDPAADRAGSPGGDGGAGRGPGEEFASDGATVGAGGDDGVPHDDEPWPGMADVDRRRLIRDERGVRLARDTDD
jgi:cyanophycin synthetase